MSTRTKVIINTLVQFAGRLITSATGFFITILIARYLGSEGYGAYAKAFALVSFFFLFIDFGLNALYIRTNRDNTQHIPLVVLARLMLVVTACFCIGLFLMFTRGRVYAPNELATVAAFIPTLFAFGLYTTSNIHFQIRLRYDLSMLAGVSGGLISLCGVYLALAAKAPLTYVALGFTSGYIVTAVIGLLLAKRLGHFPLRPIPPLRRAGELITTAFPVGITLFFNTMYAHADIFVIGASQGNGAVGIYQLAYKFFEFALAFATLFANAIFPHYVKLYSDNPPHFWRVFRRSTTGLVVVGCIFSTVMFTFAPFLSLIRPEFGASVTPLRVLSLSYPIFFATSALSWLLFLAKKERYLLAVYAASFVLNVAANMVLVPQFGYLASAWITVAGEAIVLVVLAFICKTRL